MIEGLLSCMSPELGTTLKIIEGKIDDIGREDLKRWVKTVLRPVRDSVRALLDDPENAKIFLTRIPLPSPEECRALRNQELTPRQSYDLIGLAMSVSAGNSNIAASVDNATTFAEKIYTSQRSWARQVKERYLAEETESDRAGAWLHDMFVVGAATLHEKSMTIIALDRAARNALVWLEENGQKPPGGAIGLEGGTV